MAASVAVAAAELRAQLPPPPAAVLPAASESGRQPVGFKVRKAAKARANPLEAGAMAGAESDEGDERGADSLPAGATTAPARSSLGASSILSEEVAAFRAREAAVAAAKRVVEAAGAGAGAALPEPKPLERRRRRFLPADESRDESAVSSASAALASPPPAGPVPVVDDGAHDGALREARLRELALQRLEKASVKSRL